MVPFIVNSTVILFVCFSESLRGQIAWDNKEGGGGVTLACYNLVYYFTLKMEIGYKEALTWRFSGAGKIYDYGAILVMVLCLGNQETSGRNVSDG